MDLLLSFLLLSLIIILSLLSLHNRKSRNLHLPPGTTGWPLLGETLDYFTKLKRGVPEQFAAERVAKYSSKVFKTSLVGQPMAVLSGVEGNKFLFSNENKLVRAWWPPTIDKIFPKSGHRTARGDFGRVRKILHSFLKAEGLRTYVGIMDEVMKKSLERDWIHRRELKVGEIVRKYTFALACQILLGIVDPERIQKLEGPTEDIVAGSVAMPVNLPGTALNKAIRSARVMMEEIEAVIRERKAELVEGRLSARKDVLSQMLVADAENAELMNEMDIASHFAGLLHAGYDTLNSPLTFVMKYLADLPDVYQGVLREQMEIAESKRAKELLNWEDARKMRYSWNVGSEVLRLMPPGVGAFREAITDFTYAGYTIPKGWKLHWIAHTTHKNPQHFPNPEKFDPTRFEGNGPAPYTFVPFGAGPRMCPGNEYARLAILVFMHNVVTNFGWEKLLHDEKIVSDPIPRPTQGLPIRLHRHHKIIT
ncbi:Dammarenediol 12-hydroxylase [Actinidia chinensis var. chinensis]|uniref:Dammarenediol 12-hydroxylase n=1 Tax=Actinidia chinensis var. chinensis TaxID=1590841 RepID=A0A2R6RL27_ACTCC|nr:Dammarenediol 12-hydroxylase [Actinidia chinensis var. chinensis]